MNTIKKYAFVGLLLAFGSGLLATNCDSADPMDMLNAASAENEMPTVDSSVTDDSASDTALPEFGPPEDADVTETSIESSDRPVITLLTATPLDDLSIGDTVQFMGEAVGGTPPLTYYWGIGENGPMLAGSSTYTMQVTQLGLNTVVLHVVDAKGDKDSAALQVVADLPGQEIAAMQTDVATDAVEEPLIETDIPCTSPVGTWSTSFGELVIYPDGTGIYSSQGGSVIGTLNGYVFEGTWQEEESSAGFENGNFRFIFTEDWQAFSGYWNYTSEGALGVDGASWSGTREGNCVSP